MKTIKIKSASNGASAYPLRVSDCGDGLFQIVPAYAFRGDVRWTQDYELELHNKAMADFLCAALNGGVVLDAPADLKTIEKLANGLGFETLETRNMDSLDFRDVAVWQVKAALEKAYAAGKASK